MDSWTDLGGDTQQAPGVATWGTVETQIFAVFEDGTLQNRYWDGTAWHAWERLGEGFRGPTAASARDANRIDVFAIDTHSVLQHCWWDGERWIPWEPVVDEPGSAVAVACAWIGGRLDLYVTVLDGTVRYHAMRP